MNFDLTEDQKLLVDSVASFVKKQSPVGRARKLRDDPVGWDRSVWRQMGQFGWLGVAFPEAAGGLGQSFVEAALILEQLGTTLVPEPYVPLLISGTALLKAAGPAASARWLTPALEGRTSLALAWNEAQSRHDFADCTTRAEGGVLSGAKQWVLNGHVADQLIVSARAPGGLSLYVVERGASGLHVEPVQTMDGRKAALVRFDRTPAERAGAEGAALAALDEALDMGAACACAEGVGIMRTVLAMTCDYLRTREQFGVKIGTFQALQHRAVDMFVETELSRSTAILAMLSIGTGDAQARRAAISTAKVQLAWGGRFVTQQAIQLHGGIGITDEHNVGLYFKRMHVLNTLFGDEEHHLARFAGLPGFTAGL